MDNHTVSEPLKQSELEPELELKLNPTQAVTSTVDVGTRALSDFEAAPASVQKAFFRELGRRLAEDREQNDALARLHGVELTTDHWPLGWDAGWSRRARAVRLAALAPEDDWTPDRNDDPLREIPARVYVEALTDEDVPPSGSIRCPLPDHDDFNPSFRVYPGLGWRCFGCGKSGTIYDLASLLWDVPTRGKDFHDLHVRLRAVFS